MATGPDSMRILPGHTVHAGRLRTKPAFAGIARLDVLCHGEASQMMESATKWVVPAGNQRFRMAHRTAWFDPYYSLVSAYTLAYNIRTPCQKGNHLSSDDYRFPVSFLEEDKREMKKGSPLVKPLFLALIAFPHPLERVNEQERILRKLGGRDLKNRSLPKPGRD